MSDKSTDRSRTRARSLPRGSHHTRLPDSHSLLRTLRSATRSLRIPCKGRTDLVPHTSRTDLVQARSHQSCRSCIRANSNSIRRPTRSVKPGRDSTRTPRTHSTPCQHDTRLDQDQDRPNGKGNDREDHTDEFKPLSHFRILPLRPSSQSKNVKRQSQRMIRVSAISMRHTDATLEPSAPQTTHLATHLATHCDAVSSHVSPARSWLAPLATGT